MSLDDTSRKADREVAEFVSSRPVNNSALCYDTSLRSFSYIDCGNATASMECFTDDAVIDRYGDVTVGSEERAALFERREADRSRTTCHALVNFSSVEMDHGRTMEAHYSLLVFEARPPGGPNSFVGVRTCFDRYRRVDDRWLIEYRRQRVMGTMAPTGRRDGGDERASR